MNDHKHSAESVNPSPSNLVALGCALMRCKHPSESSELAKPPRLRGKAPDQGNGWQQQKPMTSQEAAHFDFAQNNLAIRCGRVKGAELALVFVDQDDQKARSWFDAEVAAGRIPKAVNHPELLTGVDDDGQRRRSTPYKRPDLGSVPNRSKGAHPDGSILNVDVKADQGYVIAPGSTHGSGVLYQAIGDWSAGALAGLPEYDPAWIPAKPARPAPVPPVEPDVVDLQLGPPPRDDDKEPLPSVEDLKARHLKAERLRRFKTYLEFAPPSYPGMPPSGAGAHVLYLARVGVRGFLLDEREVVQTLLNSSWNRRCHNGKEGKSQQPYPWTRPDLEHKARDAARDNFDKPPGWCLLEDKKDKEPADSDEEWPEFCDLDCAFEWLNARFAFVMVGATAAVYDEKHDRVLLPTQFKQMMSPLRVDVTNKKGDAVNKPAAALWLDSKARRSYDRLVFRPDYSKAECESKKVLNRWRGFTVKPSENGSWSLLRDHILTNVCSGDEAQFQWVMQWFALLFQKPGYTKKPGTALVLRSRSRGTGKGVVGKHIGKLLGSGYMLVDDPEKILGKFNEHLQTTLLVHLDDSENKDLRDNAGILRSRITSDTLNIERKGVDVEKNVPNHMRLFMNTNDDWAVPAGEDERRFCVIDVPTHEHTQKRPYFAEIERQLGEAGEAGYRRLLHDLLTWPLTLDVGVVPKNAALAKQKLFSLHPIDKWLLHCARGRQLVTGSKPYSLAPGKTTEPKEWVRVERDELREAFRYYAASIGLKSGTDPERFGARLRDIIGEQVECWLSSGTTKKRGYRVPPYSFLLERFAKRLNATVEQLDAAPAEDPTEGQVARDEAHAALTN